MSAASMRVLVMAQPTTGGTARCVRQLAAAGTEAGVDVSVACPDSELASDVRAAGATWVPAALERAPTIADVRNVATSRSLVDGFDVLHLHSSKAGAVGRLALALRRRRPACVFTPHGWSWQSGGALTSAYRAFERATAPLADAIVAVSDEEEAAGRAVIGDRADIVVIENGIDTRHHTPKGERADRRSEPLIVCVGRLAHPKGQEVAIRALAAMQERSARLRLVGDGPDRDALTVLSAQLGVADRIEFVGHVHDAAPHLRTADVVVVPSHSEGQSLAMLEAMACGRAIVTTAVAGSSALVDAGEIVPIGDAAAMARSLDALVADAGRRAALGEVGRRRAVERFDERLCTARNIELWWQVAASRP